MAIDFDFTGGFEPLMLTPLRQFKVSGQQRSQSFAADQRESHSKSSRPRAAASGGAYCCPGNASRPILSKLPILISFSDCVTVPPHACRRYRPFCCAVVISG